MPDLDDWAIAVAVVGSVVAFITFVCCFIPTKCVARCYTKSDGMLITELFMNNIAQIDL